MSRRLSRLAAGDRGSFEIGRLWLGARGRAERLLAVDAFGNLDVDGTVGVSPLGGARYPRGPKTVAPLCTASQQCHLDSAAVEWQRSLSSYLLAPGGHVFLAAGPVIFAAP